MNCNIINSNFENEIFSSYEFEETTLLMNNYLCGVDYDDFMNAIANSGDEGDALDVYDYGNIFENCPSWNDSFLIAPLILFLI